MKTKETTDGSWPDIDETHQTPLLTQTHQTQNSSVAVNMNNSNELTPDTSKDDSNQPYFDIEQQQQSTS